MRILEKHAFSFLGQPYIWGGDDPTGFDCSGLVIEILQGAGVLPPRFDTTAQGLFNKFEVEGVANSKSLGALAFFGKSRSKITHVGFMIDRKRMIEAGGGGRHVRTLEDAVKHNAFIRVRPIEWRKDLVAILKPRYNLSWEKP